MFKALTGEFVHAGSTMNERLIKAMTERARPIREVSDAVPELVGEIVDRALSYEKANRFPDAPSMQQAVQDAYETLENAPMPSLQRPSGIWQQGVEESGVGPVSSDPSMLPISVLFDPSPGDSVLVEIDDMEGHKQRYEMRESKARSAPEADADSSPDYDRSGSVLKPDSPLGTATVTVKKP